MAIEQKVKFDERASYIIESLTNGKTREELAYEFDHSDYRSLDMYMKRRGFSWDSDKRNYIPRETWIKGFEPKVVKGKVADILEGFKKGLDARQVANETGFKDHRKMADYMKDKGYEWDTKDKTYVPVKGEVNIQEQSVEEISSKNESKQYTGIVNDELIINLLRKNREVLKDIIINGPIKPKTIPRYLIPGRGYNKNVQITREIDQLIVNFSREKGLTQREIIQVALIDFFNKYGYEHEIKALLS